MIAVLALLIALSGSAVGASLITSKRIKDGTIRVADLSPGARKALRGSAGPAGPAGPRGDAGPAGAGRRRGDRPEGRARRGRAGGRARRERPWHAKALQFTNDSRLAFGTAERTLATLQLPAAAGLGGPGADGRHVVAEQRRQPRALPPALPLPDGAADYHVDEVSAYVGANQPGDVGRASFPFLGVLGRPTPARRCRSSAERRMRRAPPRRRRGARDEHPRRRDGVGDVRRRERLISRRRGRLQPGRGLARAAGDRRALAAAAVLLEDRAAAGAAPCASGASARGAGRASRGSGRTASVGRVSTVTSTRVPPVPDRAARAPERADAVVLARAARRARSAGPPRARRSPSRPTGSA